MDIDLVIGNICILKTLFFDRINRIDRIKKIDRIARGRKTPPSEREVAACGRGEYGGLGHTARNTPPVGSADSPLSEGAGLLQSARSI